MSTQPDPADMQPKRQWRLSLRELGAFSEETQMDMLLVQQGEDAHEFWRSPVGQYLAAKAWKDWSDARDALEDVNATDTPKILELQLKARVARQFLDWLDEMVSLGKHAEQRLFEQDREAEFDD